MVASFKTPVKVSKSGPQNLCAIVKVVLKFEIWNTQSWNNNIQYIIQNFMKLIQVDNDFNNFWCN